MKYRIARDGQEIGEWTLEEIAAKFRAGELRDTDFAWAPGMPGWVNLPQILPAELCPPSLPPSAYPMPMATMVGMRPPKPDNNLVWAILATIFCCMPVGIPAIIFAAEVDSHYARGDYQGAVESAAKAWKWTKISALIWMIGVGLYIGFYAAIIFFGVVAGG